MWSIDSQAAVPLWHPDSEGAAILAFSTRRGGVSAPPFDTLNLGRSTADRAEAVAENRRRLLASLAIDPDSLATAGQVHGARVVEVRAPGLHPGCDALLTRVPGIAVAVTTADCLPLLIVAPGVVAAVHAGWRGTAAGAPRAALEAVRAAAGRHAEGVRVHLGPSIRGCCYRVGREVAARFHAGAVTRRGDSWHVDLVAAARRQLLEAGLPVESVFVEAAACTACEPSWYFSHRRDQGRTGRHWAVAALRPRGASATEGGTRL